MKKFKNSNSRKTKELKFQSSKNTHYQANTQPQEENKSETVLLKCKISYWNMVLYIIMENGWLQNKEIIPLKENKKNSKKMIIK